MYEKFFFGLGIVLRVSLIVYGEWQDSNFDVKYTDIDYYVYTDAAKYVLQGKSPFLRHTYRYSPLLSYAMVLNAIIPYFGKVIFVISDILAGIVMSKILKLKGLSPYYTILWLLNPIVFNMSTRGSSDSIASLLILQTVWLLLTNNTSLAGVVYGFAVHFRIYPLIYSILFYLHIDTEKKTFITKNRLKFTLISSGVFLILGLLFYIVYGYEFLYETYLYHFLRKDNRHNFSVYFYPLYLTYTNIGTFIGLLAFIPQCFLIFYLSVSRLPLLVSMLAATFIFVVFNKVCTAQYFIWYITLLPVTLPEVHIGYTKGSFLILFWSLTETHWLYWGYRLEFLGENVFFQLWLSSLLFFISNTVLLTQLLKSSSKIQSKLN